MRVISINDPAARYFVIGAGCALLNNGILIGADWAGAHYSAAIVLTFVITMPLAYLAHALWTFSVEISWAALARFIAGSVSSLIVAAAAVGFLRGGIGLPMILSAPIATIAMTLYNYFMARWAVGSGRPEAV